MSRIHHLSVYRSDSGEVSSKIACGLKPAKLRITGVPAKTTCGACQLELRLLYNSKENKAEARDWWKNG